MDLRVLGQAPAAADVGLRFGGPGGVVFERPEALWLLLILPVLWWLARPPRPRLRVVTAHIAQWSAALGSLRRRRPRSLSLRLVLLVAAAALAAAAAADPYFGRREGPDRVALVVDTSASMAVRDANGVSAAAQARQAVLELLSAAPPHVGARLAFVGSELAVRDVRWRDGRLDLAALAADPLWEPRGAGRFEPGRIARTLREELGGRTEDGVGGLPVAGLVVLSIGDGRGRSAGGADVRVGLRGGVANAGISACVIRDEWPLAGIEVELEVVRTQAFAAERPDRVLGVRIESAADGRPVENDVVARIEFGADARLGVAVVPARRADGGSAMLRLVERSEDTKWSPCVDALAVDDAVRIWLPPAPAPDVVVLGGGGEQGPYLAATAELLAGLGDGRVVEDAIAGSAGFVLTDGGELAAAPARAVTFGTRLRPRTADPDRIRPLVLDWDRRHPLTAGLDLSELRIERALPASALPSVADGAEVLIEGEGGPLAVLAGRGVHLAFRLDDSNLGLLAAFPQWLRRAFVYAYGAAAQPRIVDPDALLDAGESLLEEAEAPQPSAETVQFGAPGAALAPLCLLVAAILLALRAWLP